MIQVQRMPLANLILIVGARQTGKKTVANFLTARDPENVGVLRIADPIQRIHDDVVARLYELTPDRTVRALLQRIGKYFGAALVTTIAARFTDEGYMPVYSVILAIILWRAFDILRVFHIGQVLNSSVLTAHTTDTILVDTLIKRLRATRYTTIVVPDCTTSTEVQVLLAAFPGRYVYLVKITRGVIDNAAPDFPFPAPSQCFKHINLCNDGDLNALNARVLEQCEAVL
jgi:hypothetical protein